MHLDITQSAADATNLQHLYARKAKQRMALDVRCAVLTGIPGGPNEDRTHDLRIANAALSQLSYRPVRRAL